MRDALYHSLKHIAALNAAIFDGRPYCTLEGR